MRGASVESTKAPPKSHLYEEGLHVIDFDLYTVGSGHCGRTDLPDDVHTDLQVAFNRAFDAWLRRRGMENEAGARQRFAGRSKNKGTK